MKKILIMLTILLMPVMSFAVEPSSFIYDQKCAEVGDCEPSAFIYDQKCAEVGDCPSVCPSGESCYPSECPSICPEGQACYDVYCPEPEPVKSIGNLHAAGHPDRVRKNGYASCMSCHDPFNPVAVVEGDNVICTQYNPPSKFIGRTLIDPKTGEEAIDPKTGELLVGSNNLLVWYKGDKVTCNTCHYPHSSGQTYFSKEEDQIHEGCLDCHVRIGNSDKKSNRPRR